MNFLKMTVFIDADNFANKEWVAAVLRGLRQIMDVSVCRAFASHRPPKWDGAFLHAHNIDINDCPRAAAGKDAADKNLLVDAMDQLNDRRFDVMAVLSSDSDFLPLTRKVRNAGMEFWGVGEPGKAPTAYQNACTEFLPVDLFLRKNAGEIIAALRENIRRRGQTETNKRSRAQRPSAAHPVSGQTAAMKRRLVEFAQAGETVFYGNLATEHNIRFTPGIVTHLDKISDETKENDGVLLSVLVVGMDTDLPSPPFFRKAKDRWGFNLNPDDEADCKRFFEKERDRVFNCYGGNKK